jgi:hypothetical protein
MLIGNLFHFAGSEIADRFLEFLNIEETLLRKYFELRTIHICIVKAIADMFEGVGKDKKNHSLIAPLENRLFELMQLIRGVPIDVSHAADNEYANELFEYLAGLYRVFAVLYYPLRGGIPTDAAFAKEKAYLNEMASFAARVFGLRTVSEHLLLEFMSMAGAYAEHCSRRNNVALNKAVVHKVLNLALKQYYAPSTKRKAKQVMQLLKSK